MGQSTPPRHAEDTHDIVVGTEMSHSAFLARLHHGFDGKSCEACSEFSRRSFHVVRVRVRVRVNLRASTAVSQAGQMRFLRLIPPS